MADLCPWNGTATRQAITAFAEGAAQSVPPEERVAVFDNDGTLWCEKPMPIELGSILQRFAAGNSNGDVPMLRFTGGNERPALRLLVLHDDPEREFDYVKGAETALERARAEGWTVVSMRDDWATVFADA